MRIRSIHPDALKSKKLRVATAEAERCYWRLQVACDDEGRCEDDVDVLADQLFLGNRSIASEDVDGWLWELHALGLIVRYMDGDEDLLQVTRWAEYQHPQHPKKSTLAVMLPGTERIHEGSPKPGEGVELSGEEKPSALTFMSESPQDVVDRAGRDENGTVWRERCRESMQAGRARQ